MQSFVAPWSTWENTTTPFPRRPGMFKWQIKKMHGLSPHKSVITIDVTSLQYTLFTG